MLLTRHVVKGHLYGEQLLWFLPAIQQDLIPLGLDLFFIFDTLCKEFHVYKLKTRLTLVTRDSFL